MAKNEIDILLSIDDKATKILGKLEKKTKSAENQFKKSALNINASIELMEKGLRALGIAFQFIERGAKFEQQRVAFERLAKSAGISSDAVIKAMRDMSGGTISAADAMAGATKAMVLGLAPDKLPKLMEIARVSARAFGTDVGFMFDSLSLGIGRQSRMLLDNLGIIVDAEGAYKAFAEANNIVGRSLSDTEKKQAFLNAALKAGQDQIDKMGDSTQTQAEKIAQMKAQFEDLMTTLAVIASRLAEMTGGIEKLTGAMEGLLVIINDINEVDVQLDEAFKNSFPALKQAQIELVKIQEERQNVEKKAGRNRSHREQLEINNLMLEERRLLNRIVELRGSLEAQPVLGPNLPTPQEAVAREKENELQQRLEKEIVAIADFQSKIKDMNSQQLEEERAALESQDNLKNIYREKQLAIAKADLLEKKKQERAKSALDKKVLDDSVGFLQLFVKENKEASAALALIRNKDALNATYKAASHALETVPFPANFAAAAAVTAFGIANAANISGFAEGTDSVPSMLTPGEMVIPRSFAQSIREGRLTLGGAEGGVGGFGDVNIFIDGGINPGGSSVDEMAEQLGFAFEKELRTARGF